MEKQERLLRNRLGLYKRIYIGLPLISQLVFEQFLDTGVVAT